MCKQGKENDEGWQMGRGLRADSCPRNGDPEHTHKWASLGGAHGGLLPRGDMYTCCCVSHKSNTSLFCDTNGVIRVTRDA
eukprot:432320-Pelagomonas_calceolata.AAC.1